MAQAVECIPDRDLVPGLAVLFERAKFVGRFVEGVLQPGLHRHPHGLIVVEVVQQFRGETGAGAGLRFGQFRQDRIELIGVPAVGGDQPVGPEIGDLAFMQFIEGSSGQLPYLLEQGSAQHLGHDPEFADGQRRHRLIGLDKCQDIFLIIRRRAPNKYGLKQ